MKNILFALLLSVRIIIIAQTDIVYLTNVSNYHFTGLYSAYTSAFDALDRPYLYAACRELGVVIFDISDVEAPFPTDTISIAAFDYLRPTNLIQHENYLYVALGGFDGFVPQNPGMAIIDVTNAEEPVIKDVWFYADFDQGCAIVITDGKHAFLGGMDDGVIIVDVSDVENVNYVSHILPDPNFPDVPGIFTTPNARGLFKLDDETLLVANDHGGLRWIDISDITLPVETGKYINADLYNIAVPAYNNIAVKEHFAYIPVDYCGLDVVDVSDSEMETIAWINPWDCDTTNWVGSPGHTNEVRVIDDLLFLSGGDSEVLVYDISTPASPVLVGQFAYPFDSIVAWAIDVNDIYVSLALVNNSIFGIPYYSNVGGIQLLEWQAVTGLEQVQESGFDCIISPNPFHEMFNITLDKYYTQIQQIYATDMHGNRQTLLHTPGQNVSNTLYAGYMMPGMYILSIQTEQGILSKLIAKQ
jgi:hypothetical protein